MDATSFPPQGFSVDGSAGLSGRKAVVVGGGPVGCLTAISLSKMGWQVDVYEARSDTRVSGAAEQRSINLVISHRGIAALYAIDQAMTDRFLKIVIPVHGRMIHYVDGGLSSQPYDRHGQAINSVDRRLLNAQLVEEALRFPNVRFHFENKVQSVDLESRTMSVRDTAGEQNVEFDFLIGADGSHSVIRRQLMRVTRMDYQQTYIPHEYMELMMPAINDEEGHPAFALDPHHLHIWPRHSFMLMALPNQNKTFTCTLFAPTADFAKLSSRTAFIEWMKDQFPDAVPLIGESRLAYMWDNNPRSSLITIKTTPYHYKDRVIILGDAAHCQVPFFGQGLNCGLEDVRILDQLLREYHVDAAQSEKSVDAKLSRALGRYTETRYEDLIAICDLAMDNYTEMRHDVTTWSFLFRKAADNVLYSLGAQRPAGMATISTRNAFPTTPPAGWLPLYTMVTFRPDIGYATAKRKAERQGKIISGIGWTVGTAGVVSIVVGSCLAWRRWRYV